jgi:putative hydrolase of HD superfamily
MKRKRAKLPINTILNFVAEAGMLKNVSRSGWSVLGIKNMESVAEHSFRCAIIGYLLAHMEDAAVDRVVFMTLFNDIQEARITDLHKMAQRYLDAEAAEEQAYYEQIDALPQKIKAEMKQLHKEYKAQKSRESIIARDADILECLIQAKEYYEQGHLKSDKFMRKAPQCLITKSARSLWRAAKNQEICDWWLKLSHFKR